MNIILYLHIMFCSRNIISNNNKNIIYRHALISCLAFYLEIGHSEFIQLTSFFYQNTVYSFLQGV